MALNTYLDLMYEPHLLGREGAIRFRDSDNGLFPVTNGVVSDAQVTTWLTGSHQTREVFDVEYAWREDYVDFTPRTWGAKRINVNVPVSGNVSIRFSVLHYPADVADLTGPTVKRFPRWILQRAIARSQVGLMFLDRAEPQKTNLTGLLGNFWVTAAKGEPIRGLQTWAIELIQGDYFVWDDNLTVP